MKRIVSIWHSIVEKWGIRNSVVLIFAISPVWIAMLIYSTTDWSRSCSNFLDLYPSCFENLGRGFIFYLVLICATFAFVYWLIGLIVCLVLFVIRREVGRSMIEGMAMGSGAATITLLVTSVVFYFFIDWERLY